MPQVRPQSWILCILVLSLFLLRFIRLIYWIANYKFRFYFKRNLLRKVNVFKW